jgi:hypothetical protein
VSVLIVFEKSGFVTTPEKSVSRICLAVIALVATCVAVIAPAAI